MRGVRTQALSLWQGSIRETWQIEFRAPAIPRRRRCGEGFVHGIPVRLCLKASAGEFLRQLPRVRELLQTVAMSLVAAQGERMLLPQHLPLELRVRLMRGAVAGSRGSRLETQGLSGKD